jgi:hypothetical protein
MEKDKRGYVFLRGMEDGKTRWDRKIGWKRRFFGNRNVLDENGEDTAVDGRESDRNFCRLTTNDAG